MEKPNFRSAVKKHILSVFVITSLLLILENEKVTADNSKGQNLVVNGQKVPAFFLKIAKSIPRIGKRSQQYDYTVENSQITDSSPWDSTDHTNDMIKRKVGYSPESDTWNWQDFPLAIEGPPELWRSLAGYSRDPLYTVTDDFNNELWTRDKRTDSSR